MLMGFDYAAFREAVNAAKAKKYEELKQDIEKTKLFIEKMLTLSLESTSNTARTKYGGIEL